MTSTTTKSRRALGLALAGVLVLGAGAACTRDDRHQPPPIPTVGVLKAADLGPGHWTGPYATVHDSPATGRGTQCGPLALLTVHHEDQGPNLAQGMAAWVNGDVAVLSYAYLYSGASDGLKDDTLTADQTKECVSIGSSPRDPAGDSFTWVKTDATVVIQEHNHLSGTDLTFDRAITQVNNTTVGVEVSYPDGTADPPAVLDLLAKAVTASAELAKTASAGSGTASP